MSYTAVETSVRSISAAGGAPAILARPALLHLVAGRHGRGTVRLRTSCAPSAPVESAHRAAQTMHHRCTMPLPRQPPCCRPVPAQFQRNEHAKSNLDRRRPVLAVRHYPGLGRRRVRSPLDWPAAHQFLWRDRFHPGANPGRHPAADGRRPHARAGRRGLWPDPVRGRLPHQPALAEKQSLDRRHGPGRILSDLWRRLLHRHRIRFHLDDGAAARLAGHVHLARHHHARD